METKNNFQIFWSASTFDQKMALANRMGTTLAVLRQANGAWRTGGETRVGPEFARNLEESMASLGFGFAPREEVCRVCAACDLAAIARKTTHKQTQ